ncbi:hypothetical protein JOB18_018790 [Solea senegalensis]|uniref:Uncharacterized protein n=1 Tax=Solea senegalensis TaxID=28829 RepID=A0AAV6PWY4_SOLSE|nr:hypothetical protein JOB18_018790 [Solea senegalensis]
MADISPKKPTSTLGVLIAEWTENRETRERCTCENFRLVEKGEYLTWRRKWTDSVFSERKGAKQSIDTVRGRKGVDDNCWTGRNAMGQSPVQ